ncbi:MAG: 50S ribosomal protein L3 [Desulfobulbaceae bacterium]|nr:50S ribosomal protein L3 [Desulfobulbaceae bacterium]
MPKTKGILGRKLGMTRVYDENGHSIPVTVIEAGPCTVLQRKTAEKEGYDAVQLGFLKRKPSRVNKPEAGHCRRAGCEGGFYHIREFRVQPDEAYEIGQEITLASLFAVGDKVAITGVSKGRGFQGVVKRHGFGGGRKSHGSNFHRAPGSIGCSASPSRVFKGKKMPGRMGNERVTHKNLKIIDIRDDHVLLVRGPVPGAKDGLLNIHIMAA